jgi:hypothetical protein
MLANLSSAHVLVGEPAVATPELRQSRRMRAKAAGIRLRPVRLAEGDALNSGATPAAGLAAVAGASWAAA